MARSKGKRYVLMAIDINEEDYAVVRMRVPSNPDVLEVKSSSDAFRLYWQYTKPHGMQYMSNLSRNLQKSPSHVDKVLGECVFHRVSHLFLPKWGDDGGEFCSVLAERADALGIAVHRVDYSKDAELPPGIDTSMGMRQCRAWKRLQAGMEKFELWAPDDIERWGPVPGKDGGVGRASRAERRGKAHAAGGGVRQAKLEREELVTTERLDRLRAGEEWDDVFPEFDRKDLPANKRKKVMEAMEEGVTARGRALLKKKKGKVT